MFSIALFGVTKGKRDFLLPWVGFTGFKIFSLIATIIEEYHEIRDQGFLILLILSNILALRQIHSTYKLIGLPPTSQVSLICFFQSSKHSNFPKFLFHYY